MLPGMYSRKLAGAAGGAGPPGLVSVVVGAYESNVIDPANASCGFTYANSGAVTGVGGPSDTWKLTAAPASDYELRVSVTSGASPSGTLSTWLNLSTSRAFTMARSTIGENIGTLWVEIRRVSDGAVLSSGEVLMSATVDF